MLDSISFTTTAAFSKPHAGRTCGDLEQEHASPVAREALQRIGALYGIEEQIRGKPPDERRAVRRS
jgi:hypothetical protein